MSGPRALVCGGGIAGLTLAILLKEGGWEPLLVEREAEVRREGYMMDFFGTGWDVAERMGLVAALRAIRYPIDRLEFVDRTGRPYATLPIERIRAALGGRYVYLLRSDLERILYDRARAAGVAMRFGRTVDTLSEEGDRVRVAFDDGTTDDFALVFGADGLHSHIRTLTFGSEDQFARDLGGFIAAFRLDGAAGRLGRAAKLHPETDRLAWLYPLGNGAIDASYAFRHPPVAVPPAERVAFVRERFGDTGWIDGELLAAYRGKEPFYFDSLTQIVMPRWHRGRVALLGDACGALTLIAGQGSHMAMADAYVLARELGRHGGDHAAAFAAYQAVMRPAVTAKQRQAIRFLRAFLPTARSRPWLRRLVTRVLMSAPVLAVILRWTGARSVLADYR